MSTRHHFFRAWLIWFSATMFYAYEFYIRVTPTVMFPDLLRDFHISAAEVGLLSAAYYYAYAFMQIPVGLLYDRYGIRRLLILSALMVSLSCILMANTTYFWLATFARALMGLGSAFSFIACLKLARNWFSSRYLSTIIGLTNTVGIIGAIGSATPLAYLLTITNWRQTLLISSGLGLSLVFLLYLVAQDFPNSAPQQPKQHPIKETLRQVFRHPKTLLTALYGGLLVAPIAVFTEFFSVKFLMDTHALNRLDAASLSAFTFIGIAFGGPVFGLLSSWLGRRRPILFIGTLLAMICLTSLIYLPIHHKVILAGLLFGFGFFTSHMLLIFAINTERHPPWATATVIGLSNTIVMTGGTLFQPLVGWLFDLVSQGSSHQAVDDYGMVFLIPIGCQLLALLFIPWIVKK